MSDLTSTPSGGEFEVLRALYLARGHDGNGVTPDRLLRHLPKRTSVTDVTNILNAESGTYVTPSAGKYTLTAAGVARSRANKPRRSRVVVL